MDRVQLRKEQETSHDADSRRSEAFAARRGVLSGSCRSRIATLSHQLGISSESVFLATWARLLCAYNAGEQALFGVRFASSGHSGGGLWPMPIQVRGKQDAARHLEATQRLLDELQRHPAVNLEELHHWCGVPAGQTLLETLVDFAGPDFGNPPAHPMELRLSKNRGEIAFVYPSRNFCGDSDRTSRARAGAKSERMSAARTAAPERGVMARLAKRGGTPLNSQRERLRYFKMRIAGIAEGAVTLS